MPGATQIVNALQNHSWAIVTSAWRRLAEARVLAAGLPLPKVIVPVDEIRNGKPHPEGFLQAAERLGVAPRECLVFEDSTLGVEAGRRAGMRVAWVPHPELRTEYKGREREVLAGRSGFGELDGEEKQLGEIGDGWGRCLESLVNFSYDKFGIHVGLQGQC